MSNSNVPQPPRPLAKQHSWSLEESREEAWLRKKNERSLNVMRRSKSVTSDDLEELKGCMELGFGFHPNSPDLDQKLSDTIPALNWYCAVQGQNSNHASTTNIIDKGDDRKKIKQKLKQWAQVVGLSVRQSSHKPN